MYAFGSILTDSFSAEVNMHLVVDFYNRYVLDCGDNYYNLKFSIEEILSSFVDLLEEKAISNPIFKNSINKKKLPIYEL